MPVRVFARALSDGNHQRRFERHDFGRL
jgi:hypothetical protein